MHLNRVAAGTATTLALGLLGACSTDPTTPLASKPLAGPRAVVVTGGTAGAPTSAQGIIPRQFDGNDSQPGDRTATGTCARLTGIDGIIGVKLDDPPTQGSLGAVSFTRSSNNVTLAWEAPTGVKVELVSMKGGNRYNLYGYDQTGAGYQYDAGLASPANSSTSSAQISHVLVCYTDDRGEQNTTLAVEKTAVTSFARDYKWTIAKSVTNAGGGVTVPRTQSGTVSANYSIAVGPALVPFVDSDWLVSGVITISNPGPAAATITSVTDNLVGAEVSNCSAPGIGGTLDAGTSMTCDYRAPRTNGNAGVNTATVGASGTGVTPLVSSNEVPFSFVTPTSETNKTITVQDNFNNSGYAFVPGQTNPTTLTSPASATYTYSRTISLTSASCGATHYPNVARIVETGQTSAANFKLTVECGCTPGLWKNAKNAWPSPFVKNASLLGTATPSIDAMFTGIGTNASSTMLTALDWSSGSTTFSAQQKLLSQATAALLNASYLMGYKYTVEQIRAMVAGATTRTQIESTKDLFDRANNLGCPVSNSVISQR
jgi:hypothetical protein